jgi:hypothetical protein
MQQVLVRFNTKFEEASDKKLKWRVLIDDQEHLASKVKIFVVSETTENVIADGQTKWHLSAFGNVSWKGSEVTIE